MLTRHQLQHPGLHAGSSAEVITVYTTGPACMRCTLTKRMLAQKGVRFIEVDIRDNQAAREYVVDDLGYTEAPVVVVSDEDHWSGFRPDKLDGLASRLGIL
ncbi:glutaredoxin family protein [Microbacterium sp. B35-30]|jgi:glutaredoxin-like protein NrdH|uniref:glutaredoxin family protein n=1 Tax=Microbacterium sp. B35-30 TaxID=1962642 RepID=UPI0013D8B391|nr:glutaredoxin family protein [Microbacterium sp. B35-30]KAF2418200.1 NrdH-redoxin [Microbacterium sp. B35-30]